MRFGGNQVSIDKMRDKGSKNTNRWTTGGGKSNDWYETVVPVKRSGHNNQGKSILTGHDFIWFKVLLEQRNVY